MSVRIGALWLYPVKGMAGIALEEAKLLPTGIEGDRQWLVVDAQQRAVTQRECPALAKIVPDLDAGRLATRAVAAVGALDGVADLRQRRVPVAVPGEQPLVEVEERGAGQLVTGRVSGRRLAPLRVLRILAA